MTKKKEMPMWGIIGDNGLNELASIIAELRIEIENIEDEIIKMESDLDVINERLNIYIINSLDIDDFDNKKDFIFINDENEASIYPQNIFETQDIKDVMDLPETQNKYKLTNKQCYKIIDYIEEYSVVVFEYDDLLSEYNEIIEYYDKLWIEIHESLSKTNFLSLYNNKNDEEVEVFDEKKHTLFVVRGENEDWCFKYIRKKDEKKFYKQMDQEKNKEV